MKFPLLFMVLGAYVTFAMEHSRGCVYDKKGQCKWECEEGTHSYNSSCDGGTLSRRTCKEPEAKDVGPICNVSRCDCDEPTVLDENYGKCVKLEDCTKQEILLISDLFPADMKSNSTGASDVHELEEGLTPELVDI